MTGTRLIRTTALAEGITLLTLNRPEKLNALCTELIAQFRTSCDDAVASGCRVLVITGAGRAFCSGFDVNAMVTHRDQSISDLLAAQDRRSSLVCFIQELPVVTIAAVNGLAIGAGFALALACDIRIASMTAWFHAPFVDLGIGAGDFGLSWLLPRIVGLGRSAHIMLEAAPVPAGDAVAMGLVTATTDETEDLLDAAEGLAKRIALHAPFALSLTKRALYANCDAPSLSNAVHRENTEQILGFLSDDATARIDAVTRRRKSTETTDRE